MKNMPLFPLLYGRSNPAYFYRYIQELSLGKKYNVIVKSEVLVLYHIETEAFDGSQSKDQCW